MVNFSFIIPHKNTPNLLQKCLDSIPRRKDVQIIVVDDDSDFQKVDFEHFPGLNDSSVEVYLTKEGRGAGYARNVGLEHAIGKWIVFADADDFFLPDLAIAMKDYLDSDADVIVFKGDSIKIPSGLPSSRKDYVNEVIENCIKSSDATIISLISFPYLRFIKRSLIVQHNIRFNECLWGNDVVFCTKIAVTARKYIASPLIIYCLTEHDNSLVKDQSITSRIVRFEQETESIRLALQRYPQVDLLYDWYFATWFSVYKCSKRKALLLIPSAIRASGLGFVTLLYKKKFR